MDGIKIKESEDQHTLLLGYLLLTKFNYVYLKTHVYIYIYLTFDFYCLVSHACAINYSIILIKKNTLSTNTCTHLQSHAALKQSYQIYRLDGILYQQH